MGRTRISRAEVLLRLLQKKEDVSDRRKMQRISESYEHLYGYVHKWIYYNARRQAWRRAIFEKVAGGGEIERIRYGKDRINRTIRCAWS